MASDIAVHGDWHYNNAKRITQAASKSIRLWCMASDIAVHGDWHYNKAKRIIQAASSDFASHDKNYYKVLVNDIQTCLLLGLLFLFSLSKNYYTLRVDRKTRRRKTKTFDHRMHSQEFLGK